MISSFTKTKKHNREVPDKFWLVLVIDSTIIKACFGLKISTLGNRSNFSVIAECALTFHCALCKFGSPQEVLFSDYYAVFFSSDTEAGQSWWRMDGVKYSAVLEGNLLTGAGFNFQQDNDLSHTARDTIEWFRSNHVSKWPTESTITKSNWESVAALW